MAQDPYSELGVSRSASADEIRKAFRKLAKQYHPDQNPNDKGAEERFKRLSAAFDLIGDDEKRKKFDRGEIDADGHEVHRGFRGGGQPGGGFGGGGFGGGGFSRGGGAEFEGVDLNDILGEMFGRGAGARGTAGGGFSAKGADVKAQVEIELEDAIKGGKQRIQFTDGRTIDMTIPKGAESGQILRLKGQGAPGRAGPGDAHIELVIKPHPIFKREGSSLVMDLPISVPDAVLGAKIEAPTPEGPVTLTVPKGSNSGAVLRLKGRGLYEQGKRGDLLARLVVTLPEAPDTQLEVFAEQWRRLRPYTPPRKP